MTKYDPQKHLALLEEAMRRFKPCLLDKMYQTEDNRQGYHKHMTFMRSGEDFRQRCFMAANRIGKTEGAGGYELALHLTGLYPDWWQGRRFDRPVRAWAAGDTNQTTRDILQYKLLGKAPALGEMLIPARCIFGTTGKAGIPGAYETVQIQHVSGGVSTLTFKSYEQGRESFQGTEQDVILLDEEPPMDVYTECLLRTMTNDGLIMLTFTPLRGLSEVVLSFLGEGGEVIEGDRGNGKTLIVATWDDAPHLDEGTKEELLASIPPFQRDARSKGIPQLGAGAIYPVPESDFVVDPFEIPAWWPRAYGMDVGWNRTAAIFGTYDRDTETWFLVAEHYRGQAEPSIQADGIKAKSKGQTGCIDPASRGRGQKDGERLLDTYRQLGLSLVVADNAVEAGIYEVWQRLSAGRLKVFKSCSNWLAEFRLYRRDEKGRVVKENDHLMDATRYLIMTGQGVLTVPEHMRAPVNRERRSMVV